MTATADPPLAQEGKRRPQSTERQVSSIRDFFQNIGLAYFVLVTTLLGASIVYAVYQNWIYVSALGQIIQRNSLSYTQIDLGGLPQVILAVLQIGTLGTLLARTILPDVTDRLFLKVASMGLGFAVTGLTVTILADIQFLYLWSVEALLLLLILAILIVQRLRFKEHFIPWLRSLLSVWKIQLSALTLYERVCFAIIGVITVLVYYDAIMFPISEVDAIIYHASAAAIAYYNHGMPLIDGGGIGLGSSSNYPLFFSYLGTYFYLFSGAVRDVYLRAVTPTMWLLSILTTYMAGVKIGGRRIGLIAMFLVAVVPSYLSYAYQTTQETTVTFFLVLGFLFLIYATSEESKTGFYQACGMSFGAACLTSYQALFFLVPLGVVVGIRYWRSETPWRLRRGFLWLVISLISVGSAPYVRNFILLHNPVFPFFNEIFQSPNLSSSLFSQTLGALKYTAYSYVNPSNPTLAGFLLKLATYPSFYPLNPTLIIPSLILLSVLSMKEKQALALFVIVPAALILLFPAPFVRYFWLMLPFAAIAVSRVLISSREALNLHSLLTSNSRIVQVFRLVLPVMLVCMLLFPAFVLLGVQNYTFIPNTDSSVTNNYLRYFTNPGMNASGILPQIYGTDPSAWNWLNTHYGSGKVATFETRIYYMNFALRKPNSILYLDSSHAFPLYGLNDLPSILGFMQNASVRFIFVRAQDWKFSLFSLLPFTQLLGSPYFPLQYANGLSQVFSVGLKSDPIVTGSAPAYTYHLSAPFNVNMTTAENVTAGDNSATLYVETDNALTVVDIRYLDSGTGSLNINVFNPVTKNWLNSYVTIQKHGTERWNNFSFLVPLNLLNNYSELGLFANQSNFTISTITTSAPLISGRNAYRYAGPLQVSNQTNPRAIMIYLPILNPGDRISIQTATHSYNISLTVFSGYIALNQTSSWQLNYQSVANYPASGGVQNPSLQWSVKDSGLYTLVLTLTDITSNNVSIDVSIVIGAAS